MEKLAHYRQAIQSLLKKHISVPSLRDEQVENELIIDPIQDHYQWMKIGWDGLHQVYHIVIHFEIRDGEIWIQQNMTDIDLGQELVDLEVPKEDIVLGLHPPYKRPYTGYGVA